MTRSEKLRNALKDTMTVSAIDDFINYQLTEKDEVFIKETGKQLLERIPQKAFNCAAMTAMWAAMIEDHSNIPAAVVCGHLDFYKRRIFNCKSPIPIENGAMIIKEVWDGHCWLEFGGLIADPSFFRTIYYGNVPVDLKKEIINKFGEGRGFIIGPATKLKESGFEYTPCYCLSKLHIEGLVNGLISTL